MWRYLLTDKVLNRSTTRTSFFFENMRQKFALSFQLIVCSKKCRPLLLLFSVYGFFTWNEISFPKKRYTVYKMRKIFRILESQVLKIPRKTLFFKPTRLTMYKSISNQIYVYIFIIFQKSAKSVAICFK